jgi:hypothetical protein
MTVTNAMTTSNAGKNKAAIVRRKLNFIIIIAN